MNNKELKAETEVQQSDAADLLPSAPLAAIPMLAVRAVMPCGSNHSCHHCNGYYFGCTWLERMTEDEYEKHDQLVIASR